MQLRSYLVSNVTGYNKSILKRFLQNNFRKKTFHHIFHHLQYIIIILRRLRDPGEICVCKGQGQKLVWDAHEMIFRASGLTAIKQACV